MMLRMIFYRVLLLNENENHFFCVLRPIHMLISRYMMIHQFQSFSFQKEMKLAIHQLMLSYQLNPMDWIQAAQNQLTPIHWRSQLMCCLNPMD